MNAIVESNVSVRAIDAPLGAEIVGADVSVELDRASFDLIQAAINRRHMIVLRDQKLTAEALARFTRYFGEFAVSVYSPFLLKGTPVCVLSNIVDENGKHVGLFDAGPYWHTDNSFSSEPHAYSLLYALEVPHDADGRPLGDTQFVNTVAAYEALPDELKAQLADLQAVHRFTKRFEGGRTRGKRELTPAQMAEHPDRAHPVIRTHPLTGDKSLYVNESYTDHIVGMPLAEGRALVDRLCRHCTDERFYYRHAWRVGDLVMWDNCATQHKSTLDYALPQRRLLYRTGVKGAVPV